MLLELLDVHAGYGPVRVLHGISLGLGDGDILGVLGRNGMGKTTLIRCIAGLLPAAQGTVQFAGGGLHAPCSPQTSAAWAGDGGAGARHFSTP